LILRRHVEREIERAEKEAEKERQRLEAVRAAEEAAREAERQEAERAEWEQAEYVRAREALLNEGKRRRGEGATGRLGEKACGNGAGFDKLSHLGDGETATAEPPPSPLLGKEGELIFGALCAKEGELARVGWMRADEAGAVLGLSASAVNLLAREGKLERTVVWRKAYFWRAHVEALRFVREQRAKERFVPPRPRMVYGRDISQWPEALRKGPWINSKQAAEILMVHPMTITNLVRRGVLPAGQDRPGKQGSPLKLRQTDVEWLLWANAYYHKRKEIYWNRQLPEHLKSKPTGWEKHRLRPVTRRGTDVANSRLGRGYYSGREVAGLLGVSVSRVQRMRLTGRLNGFQRPPNMKGPDWLKVPVGGNRWWFYTEEEVFRLMSDPAYIERRARWAKSKRRPPAP
jgi:hypothetical protein